MASEQINITLGTAGHIDHGKTALVKCLTGCETDRLKAEKERGMSIDLGFAPCTISDMEVGIVDVPGHENFVKTMVAGASGMDGVILVVAADDGVMPQTREHLDILTLLGVEHGLVALTKVDRVEPDHLELARADVEDFVRGTFLDDAPILPLSSISGEGFVPFLEALDALVRAIKPRRLDGVFRLPVDRAFSAKGYGTVVAGIPVCGSAGIGDEVALLPDGATGRIRRIEVYGRDSDTVKAGQCAALNIRQWEHRTVDRGDVAATPGYFSPQQWYACTFRLLEQDKLFLKSGTRVKFHTGASEVVAAVYPMQGNTLQAGQQAVVQVKVDTPLVAGPGDHFIIRSLSPVQTVGGGMVIEAVSRRLKRNRPNVCEDLQRRADAVRNEKRFVEYCVRAAEGLAAGQADLSTRAKVPRDRLGPILEDLVRAGKIELIASGFYVHRDSTVEAQGQILGIINDFHRQSPESPGLTLEQLRQSARLDRTVLNALVSQLKADGRLVERNHRLAAAEHRATFQEEDSQFLDAVESLFRNSEFHPPSPEQVAGQTGADAKTVDRILRILLEHERLVRVADGLLFHREAVERAQEILVSHIRKQGKLESVDFKYLLDTSRKFAIPMLDHLDKSGVIRRVGNTRYLRTKPDGAAE